MESQRTLLKLERTPSLLRQASVEAIEHANSLCDTRWTGLIIGLRDNESGERIDHTLLGRNFCKQRNCSHPPCIKNRITRESDKFTAKFKHFRRREKCSHTTLTFGKNLTASECSITDMKRYYNNFLRQLNYRSHYRSVAVFELKRQPNGLYHPHIHIAFEYTPHLNKVISAWERTLGHPARVDVRYHSSKKAVIRYFSRRVALAGLNMPVSDFSDLLHGRQLTNLHGFKPDKPDSSIRSNLVVKRIYPTKTKKYTVIYVFYIGQMPKLKGETIPPPLSEWGYS